MTNQPQYTHSRRSLSLALITAMMILGALAPNALAGGSRSHHRHYAGCGHSVPEYAGRIYIDGTWTSIRSDRAILPQLVRAFRYAGYSAWIADGCMQVDYGYRRPNVRWSRDRYSAWFDWDYGQLSISVHRIYPKARHHRRYPPIRRVAKRSFGWGYHD